MLVLERGIPTSLRMSFDDFANCFDSINVCRWAESSSANKRVCDTRPCLFEPLNEHGNHHEDGKFS